jgi:hypothetical protein
METVQEFEADNKSKLNEDEKRILSSKFSFISPRNIASVIAKYLPGATPFDKKQGPQYCSMYVAAIGQVSNSEGSYNDAMLMLHLGKNHRQQVSRYRKLHREKVEKVDRYRKTYIMVLHDLLKKDEQLQKSYEKKISQ